MNIIYLIYVGRTKFYQENSEAGGKGKSYSCKSSHNPCIIRSWPASGWQDSPECFPVISSTVILRHLLKTGKQIPGSEDTVVVQKPLKEAMSFSCGVTFTKLNSNIVVEFGLFSHTVGLHNAKAQSTSRN